MKNKFKMPLTDPHVNLTMNVFLIIGNVINLIQNLPQVIKTYKTKSTRDFSTIFLVLRIIGNLIWIAYAIQINSILLIVNNTVTVLSTVFIFVYKVREIIHDRKQATYAPYTPYTPYTPFTVVKTEEDSYLVSV
jgi:MtN3 and saliva related transmembrane protein